VKSSDQQRRASQRMSLLEAFLKQDPNNTALIREATGCAFAAGLSQKGLDLSALLIRLQPDSPMTRVEIANLQMEHGLWLEAERHWEKVMRDGHESDIGVVYARAYACYRMEKLADAAELLRPFVLNVFEGWGERAACLWMRSMHRLGRESEVWSWYEANRDMCAPFLEIAGIAALIALDCGDLDCARRLSAFSLKSNSLVHVEAQIAAASVALCDGDLEKSRTVLRSLLSRCDEPRAWMTLGLAELSDLRLGEARKCLERSVARSGDARGWQTLGWIHFLEGSTDQARSAFIRALEMDSSDVGAAEGLARASAVAQQPWDHVRLDATKLSLARQLVSQAMRNGGFSGIPV